MMSRQRKTAAVTVGVLGFVTVTAGLLLIPRGNGTDVVETAYRYTNGGGYCSLRNSGVPEDIIFKGVTILPRSSGGTYCCGFTFAVAMRVAEKRGLLSAMAPYQIGRFQREWYGATQESRLKQVVTAMEHLGIGYEVYPLDARAGDFMVFSTTEKTGHSVIFLGWIRDQGKIVGIRYRSSQAATHGVGDSKGYFTTSGYRGGSILPQYVFAGRLKGG